MLLLWPRFVTQPQTHIQDFLESYHGFFKNDIMVVFMKQTIYLECFYFGDPFASVAFVLVGVSDIVCSLQIYYLEYLACIY